MAIRVEGGRGMLRDSGGKRLWRLKWRKKEKVREVWGKGKVGDALHHWPACWCSGCVAWPEIRPCQSQACGSSSGLACTSPLGNKHKDIDAHTITHTNRSMMNSSLHWIDKSKTVRIVKNLIKSQIYLTSESVCILQSLINLALFQVILWPLSFHLLVKLLLVLHLWRNTHWDVSNHHNDNCLSLMSKHLQMICTVAKIIIRPLFI